MFEAKSEKVRSMFGRIAKTYDLTNQIITFGRHQAWKKKLISYATGGQSALDLCTGTGDLLPQLAKKYQSVIGVDFCAEMLQFSEKYLSEKISVKVGDVLNLQYPDDMFDCITISYGIRNLEDLAKGLSEIRRVLKVNGQLLILESGQVQGILAPFFRFYSDYIIPRIGGFISGDRYAYNYLPKTASNFPYSKELVRILNNSGFSVELEKPLMFGASYLYTARKI